MTEMHDPQGTLLNEVTMPSTTQGSVAFTYAYCIAQLGKKADWQAINLAIIQRWKGKTALNRIKELAWLHVAEWREKGVNHE